MRYLKTFNNFINEGLSVKVKKIIIDKFKLEKPELTDVQIEYYLNRFDELKNSPKIVQKDILRYNFKELENLIDSIPVKVSGIKNTEYSPDDIIYNENGLIILKGDTKDKCIRYGKGYSWCISRKDSSNMFNTYRYRYDEINFYFIFDSDMDKSNPYHALVLLIDKSGKFYITNLDNSGDFAGSKEFTFNQIIKFQPKLKNLKSLFKPLTLTSEEKNTYNLIKKEISGSLFEKFKIYDLVDKYISYVHKLNDNQYLELDDTLKYKYINLNHILTDKMIENTNHKFIERYNYLHSLQSYLDQKYSKNKQYNLTHLVCSFEILTSLKGIENLTNLTYLSCSSNQLTSLKGIENLTNLKLLDCSYNQLTTLKEIENLTNLKLLDCSYNQLTTLKGIENLTNLATISCSSNQLTSLKEIENLTNLKLLNCSSNQLTSLKGIENFTNLTDLSCSNNQLTTLKEIENLTRLEKIYCYSNQLTTLKEIEKLINLTYLSCSSNQLTTLKGIENLTRLEKLYFSNNKLPFNINLSIKKIQNYYKKEN